jgi:hypothetical protein
MPENSNDSAPASAPTHEVLPVANPAGGVDHIAVPIDTNLGDLHAALSDAGYLHPALDTPATAPTKEGSLEYSEPFRKVAAAAWNSSALGMLPGEAGAYLDAKGQPSKVQWQGGDGSHAGMTVSMPAAAPYLLHTHPNNRDSAPSPQDIKSAVTAHKTIYVTSKAGLFAVDPKGNVSQVFRNSDWASQKKPK